MARVLVADDNADMREYIARILGDRFAVFTVADGRSALDAALSLGRRRERDEREYRADTGPHDLEAMANPRAHIDIVGT